VNHLTYTRPWILEGCFGGMISELPAPDGEGGGAGRDDLS